jgi:hypothetical protein
MCVLINHAAAQDIPAFINWVHGHSIEDRSDRSYKVARGTCSRFSGTITHGRSPLCFSTSSSRVRQALSEHHI